LEAIVGDISSIDAQTEPSVVKREDGSLLLDGMLPVDDLKGILHVSALPGEQNGYYHTLAGFIMMKMGRIPSSADHFDWGGFRFEVVDMDGRRIDKVLVMSYPKAVPFDSEKEDGNQ
jgi:putative hemolysin